MKPREFTMLWRFAGCAMPAAVAALLVACGEPDHAEFDAAILKQDAREQALIERGQATVLATLKDPYTADFRNVYFHHGMTANVEVVCGEVNSRNSFGAYSGFRRFLSNGTTGLTVIDEQVDGFNDLWRRYCI